jgi:hypothetical protein
MDGRVHLAIQERDVHRKCVNNTKYKILQGGGDYRGIYDIGLKRGF